MWRRIRDRELAETLVQRNDVPPTSSEAYELATSREIRRNAVRHLAQEREGFTGDGEFRSGLGDIPGIGYPGSDAVWFYLRTLFFVEVTDEDEVIEVAFVPSENHEDENFFAPLFYGPGEIEVWIDLRGYFGNESFITDAFVRPYQFSFDVFHGSWNATLRFAHNTRKRVGTLIGRVLVRRGQPPRNIAANDFTMSQRLKRSESVYAQRALEVPRLDETTQSIGGMDACAVWVHGTLSCGLEGLKDLASLPPIPMYRFEHDTFHEICDNASELTDLVTQLGYKRTYLIAHSRGGLVARFCQQTLLNRFSTRTEVITFGTPHQGTPIADAAAGGLALFMRAGDFLIDGIPYASAVRRAAGLFVGLQLPPGISAMQPTSEVLKTGSQLLSQPFESWAGVYQDGSGSVGYGQDFNNVAQGVFGPNVDHDLVVPTVSSLGGNTATQINCAHSDYLKNTDVQQRIASLA